MKKYYICCLFCFFTFFNNAKAAVIFEDKFDNKADWQPRPGINDVAPAGAAVDCNYGQTCTGTKSVPEGWTHFRTTGWWWGPNYEDTIRITNQADHGSGGKSFIVYNEANNGASGDGWGSDGILAKLFDEDQQEINIRFWLKTQAGWKWPSMQDMMVKIFRVYHFDKNNGAQMFNYFGDMRPLPLYIWDAKHSQSWGTRYANSPRCAPLSSVACPGTTIPGDKLFVANDLTIDPSGQGMFADGQWHRFDFHFKMNSYDSNSSTWNSDGIFEFFYDGVQKESHQAYKWKYDGADPSTGWNVVAFGGNAYNSYNNYWSSSATYNVDDVVLHNSYNWKALQANTNSQPGFSNINWSNLGLTSEQKEQWYAIDDVVVSTEQIPENYVIGSSNLDFSAPANPFNLNVL